jgi:hypothetical protein
VNGWAAPRSTELGGCLPSFALGANVDVNSEDSVTEQLLTEEERGTARFYSSVPRTFTKRLGIISNGLCDALGIEEMQQPLLRISENEVWQAIPREAAKGRPRDIVRLSKSHLIRVASDESTDTLLFAVLAHEFSHVFQFVRAMNFQQTEFLFTGSSGINIPRLELHADYMAGFCLARTIKAFSMRESEFLNRFGHTFFRLGDFKFGLRDHHGTPAERFAATMAGFLETSAGSASPVQIARLGVAFVSRLKP